MNYYNEYDPGAAAVLRELIKDNLISPGIVDERSIELVQPSDLRGFRQVHLFAGFGIWSLAARLAGWPDDRPLWSASCPCPPFSSAGKAKACPECGRFKPIPHVRRTGFFLCAICGHAWLADQRHLWPEVWRLIRDERPPCLVGEQVASEDGRTWLDLVRASMEILAYDTWGVDTCAAGFGAPHIRQRLYWVADTASFGRERGRTGEAGDQPGAIERPERFCDAMRLVDSERSRLEGLGEDGNDRDQPGRLRALATGSTATPGESSGVDNPFRRGRRARRDDHGQDDGCEFDATREQGPSGLANASGRPISQPIGGQDRGNGNATALPEYHRPGPVNGLWQHADWIGCRDERFRAVEPGTFPLAPARTFRNRVVELRGAGNAINLAQAAEFIAAVMPELPG